MDENFVASYREHTSHVAGGEVIERGGVTLFHVPRGELLHNAILLQGRVGLDELLAAIELHPKVREGIFCIFTRAHADRDLEAELEAAGYLGVVDTPGMALRRERWRPASLDLPAGFELRAVASDADAIAYGELVAEAFGVYGVGKDAVRAFFTKRASLCGPGVQGFLGWLDGEAVTCAALYPSADVAGVGWVGTHPTWFGRKLGEAVTGAVVEEGFRRGLAIANLQASPMGRTVYERMGFETPTSYKAFIRRPA